MANVMNIPELALHTATSAIKSAIADTETTLQQRNIARVQKLVGEYMNGNAPGYLEGCADSFSGSVLAGLIPGGDNIKSKAEFIELMGSMDKYMEVKKFEPCNWRATGDDVLFQVNWIFVWKPTGVEHETTALVRKVVRNDMICEKYHMCDVAAITGGASPHDMAPVTTVRALLDEYLAGKPEGYLAGVSDDMKGSVLEGLIPGAVYTSKEGFASLMGEMENYMEVRKFAPREFRALPNNDMMFLVDWEFLWLPTNKLVTTTAVVRKVVKDGKICEKYHMVDCDAVLQQSPRDVIVGTAAAIASGAAAVASAIASGAAAIVSAPANDFADTTFATFTPSTTVDAAVPVLLFQSGYGSSSVGHQPLMQAIADAGYVCVIPDREGDVKGGKESVGALFAGLAEGKPASEHNAMSTDGTHLAAALKWVKAQTSVDGQRIDASKIAGAGFSMGCVEAIQFAAACAADVKAVCLISSSTGEMLEKLYAFEQADLAAKCAAFACPSLWITSDLDSQKGATSELFDVAASPASLVVFKDEVLDNSMALTDEMSIWSPAVNDMLPGIAQHFALATERTVVSDAPIIAFLNHHLKGADAAPLAADAAVFEQKAK